MKNKRLRIGASIVLMISILFLCYRAFSRFELLKVKGNLKENFYPYLKVIISLYFAILLLLVFSNKYTLNFLWHLLWLTPLLLLFFVYGYGSYNIKKIDYFIGSKQKIDSITEYTYKSERIKKIVIGKNVLLYSSLPCCDDELYSVDDIKKAKVKKSWITGYYYLSIPTTVKDTSVEKITPSRQ